VTSATEPGLVSSGGSILSRSDPQQNGSNPIGVDGKGEATARVGGDCGGWESLASGVMALARKIYGQ